MSKLSELNDHLFDQLKRLSDTTLTKEKLAFEVQRTKAITSVSKDIVKTAQVAVAAERCRQEFRGPSMGGGKKLLEDYS